MSPNTYGKLYVVATPIGNLNDFSARAQTTLQNVSWIACEDTRHCQPLLKHYTINTRCVSLHNFNEKKQMQKLINLLKQGEDGALISDAGTPLINDPGFHLVAASFEEGIQVVTVPGPCAAVAAVSSLAITQGPFYFEGFLPPSQSARKRRLDELSNQSSQIVFYEAPHRIKALFEDLYTVFGPNRLAGVARELTKLYESLYRGTISEIHEMIQNEHIPAKGEFVVVVQGCEQVKSVWDNAAEDMIKELLPHLPINKVSKIVSNLTKIARKDCYNMALSIQDSHKS